MDNIQIIVPGESDTAQDIKRCLTVLFGTRVGSLAMDRDFGLTWDFLDLSTRQAQAEIRQEIMEKVAKYESRAKVTNITFTGDTNGTLTPKIEVAINE